MIKSPVPPQDVYRRVLSLVGQVGCMTIVIVLAAGFLGRWLDSRFNSGRSFTLWLILVSFPLTLLLMYGLVRLSIRGIAAEKKSLEDAENANEVGKEEVENGRNS